MGGTLLELISKHQSVASIAEFAKRMNVGRASIYRWDSTLPTPDTVRRIADALGEPYAVVLAAALRSGGYITDNSDMLAGLQVHVVSLGLGYEEGPVRVPVVAYAEKEYAEKVIDDADVAYGGGYTSAPVVIAAHPPQPAETWFARYERGGANETPRDLSKCVVSHSGPIGPTAFPAINDDELTRTGAVSAPSIVLRNGYLMRVDSSAFDEAAARLVVERTLAMLRDRIPPVGTDFITVNDLPPITDPLPEVIEISGDFHGEPFWSVAIDALLSTDETVSAANAYRAAREVNATAAAIIAAFDAQAQTV